MGHLFSYNASQGPRERGYRMVRKGPVSSEDRMSSSTNRVVAFRQRPTPITPSTSTLLRRSGTQPRTDSHMFLLWLQETRSEHLAMSEILHRHMASSCVLLPLPVSHTTETGMLISFLGRRQKILALIFLNRPPPWRSTRLKMAKPAFNECGGLDLRSLSIPQWLAHLLSLFL